MGLTIVSGNEMMGEDTRRAYDETMAIMRKDFGPIGTIETMLVDQMGQIAWEIKQIEAYERYITAKKEQEHEDKINDWWKGRTRAPINDVDGFISRVEYDNECLDHLSLIFKSKDSKRLNGKKVIRAIHDVCNYQGDEDVYETDHPDFPDTVVYVVPGEEGRYYEKSDCEGMYKSWNVGRARKCVTYLAEYFEALQKSMITETKENNDHIIMKAQVARDKVDEERKRLKDTKILIMDEVRDALAPYRTRKSNAMDRILKLSTQLATIQAKRQGEIAANTPIVIEAAFDTMPSTESQKESPRSQFDALLSDIEKLGDGMPKLTDILNMPNGATL